MNDVLKSLSALVLILLFLGSAIYFGLWVCFIGGFIGLIQAIGIVAGGAAVPVGLIAWSIVKILLTRFVIQLSAMIFIVPAVYLTGQEDSYNKALKQAKERKSRKNSFFNKK